MHAGVESRLWQVIKELIGDIVEEIVKEEATEAIATFNKEDSEECAADEEHPPADN